MRFLGIVASLVVVPGILVGGQPAAAPIGPADAAKLAKSGQVTVEMAVQSVGISKGKEHWWLNSEADWKDGKNFSVFIPKSTVEKLKKNNITDPEQAYKGKTIQVTGNVLMHNTTPQITLQNPDHLKVVK